MKEIDVITLKKMKDSGEKFQLIDVREAYEVEICTIGGDHIPMGEVMENLEKIKRDIPVIIHCRSGERSAAVVQMLESSHGFSNLNNLSGGILAYAEQVDQTLTKY